MARIELTKKQEETFSLFVRNIPQSVSNLELLMRSYTKQENYKIVYSQSELTLVCEMYISLLGTKQEQVVTSLLESYIGEAWKHFFGGEWAICIEKNDPAFLKPIIYWGYDSTPRFCPMEEIAFLQKERNKESFLDSINYSKEMLAKHKKAREILFGDFKEKKK